MRPKSAYAILILAAACRRSPQATTEPEAGLGPNSVAIAVVGDREITAEQLRKFLSEAPPEYGGRTPRETVKDVLKKLIHNELLAQEAARHGYADDPRVRAFMVDRFVAAEFEENVRKTKFSDDVLRRYYDAHLDMFQQPRRVRVSQIVVTDRPLASEIRRAVVKLERDDIAGFRALVEKHSIDNGSKIRGGDLAYLTEGTDHLPRPLVRAALALERVGDVSELLETEQGIHILLLTEKRNAMHREFEESRVWLETLVRDETKKEQLEALVLKLEAQTKREVFEDRLSAFQVPEAANTGPARGNRPPPIPRMLLRGAAGQRLESLQR